MSINTILSNYFRKRTFFFSFFVFNLCVNSQVILRNSDNKKIDSVLIVNNDKIKTVNLKNLKNYRFETGDKLSYQNDLFDFAVYSDTLIFFDKVKEIQEVKIVKNKLKFTKIRNNRGRCSANIFSNCRTATFINIDNKKDIYLKSFSIFIRGKMNLDEINGNLEIRFLKNNNGTPDQNNILMEFSKDITVVNQLIEQKQTKWEILLPETLKLPNEGFFIELFLPNISKSPLTLKQCDDSEMLMFFPKENVWKKLNINAYYIELKLIR